MGDKSLEVWHKATRQRYNETYQFYTEFFNVEEYIAYTDGESSRPAPNVLKIVTYFQNFHLYYSFVLILRRYNTSFKILESNEVKSLVLAANRKQGTI